MNRLRRLTVLIGLSLIISITVVSAAMVVLNFPAENPAQEHDQWTWAAASQAVLSYYGTSVSQCTIANWAWGRADCCGNTTFSWSHACNSSNYMYGTTGSLQGILSHWGVNSSALATYLSQATVVSEINAGRPFVMRWGWTSGGGHFLVGYGYEFDGAYVDYWDPWPGNGPTRSTYTYVVGASDHNWTHTLQLTTAAPSLPVSINEAVDNPSLTFANSAGAPWLGQASVSYYGGDAAQSGAIGNSGVSSLISSVTGPATVSFYWKTSSEPNYDFLKFYVDGLQVGSGISGITSWSLVSVGIAAGTHTLGWVYSKDSSVSEGADAGYVDDIVVTAAARRARADFDGDRKSDLAFWRSSAGTWWVLQSASNYTSYLAKQWGVGAAGDTPVPGDYDGDGKTDLAFWRPSAGTWWVLLSSSNYTTYLAKEWGSAAAGDIPVPGDYDGDRKTDFAFWRPSAGAWWVLLSGANYTTYMTKTWGTQAAGDVPVQGDYDGDGKTDPAFWRPSAGTWWALLSGANYTTYLAKQWGVEAAGDMPLPADFDGDGKTDLAFWRPSAGTWWVLLSGANYTTYLGKQWGVQAAGDAPLTGDFDGDGKADMGLWRSSAGTWWILLSGANYTTYLAKEWGSQPAGDAPVVER